MPKKPAPRKKIQTRRARRLKAALAYADQGVPVFPVHSVDRDGICTCGDSDCANAGKHPGTANGHKDATTDRDQIRHWWSKKAWNIGAVPGRAGFAVFDVDPRKRDESDRVQAIVDQYGPLPSTFTVLTGKQGDERGRHRWFRVPENRTLPSKVKGIDVRSGEAYVLMPPSRHHSGVEYEVEDGDLANVAIAPAWLQDESRAAGTSTSDSEARELTGVPIGTRAHEAIRTNTLPIPDEGESHRNVAVSIARNLFEAGTPADAVLSFLAGILENPGSNLDPDRPWTEKDAVEIVRSVVRDRAPDSGSFSRREGTFSLEISTLQDARNLANQEIDYVIPGVIAKGDKAVVAGPPKAYKTWLVLHIARSVACAEPLFGREEWTPEKPSGVLLVQEEGAPQQWGRRLELVFGSEEDHPVYYSHKSGLNLQDNLHVDSLIAEALARDVGLVVIDPFQRVTAGVNENDAADTGPVWDSIHRIARETGAAVLVVHHSRKQEGEPTMDSIRGSSRMAGEVDFMIVQKKMDPGHLGIFIDGRDLVLEDDSNYLSIKFEKDKPHQMKLTEMTILPYERAATIGTLATRELERAGDWLSSEEIAAAIAEDFGKVPSTQAVTDAMHKVVDEGKAQNRRGARNKLFWRLADTE